MLRRPLFTLSLLAVTAVAAHAAARNPQIPVSGSALATFFASQGQTIDVNNQQLDLQTLSVPATTNFELRAFGPGVISGSTFGAYGSAFPPSPPLYQIFPGALTSGWYPVASFRTGPTRLVVSLFDSNNAFQGSTSYLAGPPDPNAFGFYLQQASSFLYYTEDSRNPGGGARILAYNGTGSRVGWTWFAIETGAGPGGDYADYIALVNLSLAPVPVNHTDWGTLKSRFR